jgi:hypothetical protein
MKMLEEVVSEDENQSSYNIYENQFSSEEENSKE